MTKLSKAQEAFLEKLNKAFEKDIIPWRATWDNPILPPYNEVTNSNYTGINQLNLFITSLQNGWDDPRWMTFKQANEKGYKIKKGAVGTDIYHFSIRNIETNQLINSKEYKKLNEREQKKYQIVSKSYRAFNGTQINGLEKIDIISKQFTLTNEKAQQFSETLAKEMSVKVMYGGNKAYYQPQTDVIYIPKLTAFQDEESYYATFLHECAHASGHENRLRRNIYNKVGTKDYALEELRAEFTSVFLTLDVGFRFNDANEDNHVAYIQYWKEVIKDNPHLILTAINDAQNIRKYLLEKGEYSKLYHDESTESEQQANSTDMFLQEEVNFSDYQVSENTEKKTIVINLFAGPGAGKTTCAWEISSMLKKLNYVTEYVPEYAKELVWDGRRDLLDGTLEHQQALLKEQTHRVDRLIGKVDFIVTDAPELINLNFLKTDDDQIRKMYEKEVVKKFSSRANFNLFIQRGEHYETAGRVHTLAESKILDTGIKKILEDHNVYYGTYSHKTIDQVIQNCITTYNKNQNNEVLLEETYPVSQEEKKDKVSLNELKDSISILEYARDVLNFSLIKESRGLYRIEEHDSCKIYPNNTFYRFSNNAGGSIIDFIKHFEECDTLEAIEKMKDYYQQYHPEVRFNSSKKEIVKINTKGISNLEVPEKNSTDKHIFAYLTKTRGIKPSIVKEYIDKKLLYEDVRKNCVWIGKFNNTISYATVRSSNAKSKFKQDINGSIKEIGIFIYNNSKTLIINEAVIDQMSYMSLAEEHKRYDYLSTQGAANTVSALRFHMNKREESKQITKIVFALDNDRAGEENTLKAIKFLQDNYPNIETQVHIPEANDFNEQLQKELEILASAAPNILQNEGELINN